MPSGDTHLQTQAFERWCPHAATQPRYYPSVGGAVDGLHPRLRSTRPPLVPCQCRRLSWMAQDRFRDARTRVRVTLGRWHAVTLSKASQARPSCARRARAVPLGESRASVHYFRGQEFPGSILSQGPTAAQDGVDGRTRNVQRCLWKPTKLFVCCWAVCPGGSAGY